MQNFASSNGAVVSFFKAGPRQTALKKIGRVMKLTLLLLLVALLNAKGNTYGQQINLDVKNRPLGDVCAAIEKQSNYVFVISSSIDKEKLVSIKIKTNSINQIMSELLKDTELEFALKGQTITIYKIERKILRQNFDAEKFITITGKIYSEGREVLHGASVVVKRTGDGVLSDINGVFIINNLLPDDILEVSYTGYSTITVRIQENKVLNIEMKLAENILDEAVVQAYGITTRRYNTGNIDKISSEVISKQPITNPLQALQGRVPGLIVKQTAGQVSAPFKIELRGRNSLSTNYSEPLIIIDGIPLLVTGSDLDNYNGSNVLVSGFGGPANGQSPLYSINPADIESIEILKDADATAIYGSRGANGVIIISTKKGKPGKLQVDANVNHGINKITRFWDLLNTKEYIEIRREALANDGFTPDQGNAPDLTLLDTNRYTDWQRKTIGGTGKNLNAQISVSGGNNLTKVRFSGGYSKSTDILTVQGASERISFAVNVNSKLTQKLTISFAGSFSSAVNNLLNMPAAHLLPPNAPTIFDSSGKLNWSEWAPLSGINGFPFGSLLQKYKSESNSLLSNISLEYQIINNLVFRASLGYSNTKVQNNQIFPKLSFDPEFNRENMTVFGDNSVVNTIIEPQLQYSRVIRKGRLNVLFGATVQQNISQGNSLRAFGYSNEELMYNRFAATSIVLGPDNYIKYKYAGIFARVNYAWQNKYLATITARRDGSSRFGVDKQFSNFGSVGLGWVFSQEKFFKNLSSWFSFGKLRASYGITGSDNIGDYKYLSTWQGVVPYQGSPALYPTQLGNPDYQWEQNKKLEAGIEFSFLKDNINTLVSWYRNRCDNQLVGYRLPSMTGFNSVINNLPALIENSGWEFSISANALKSKDTKLSFNFNIGLNKNKLVSFPGIEGTPYSTRYEVGKPLNLSKMIRFTGVDPQTGLYTFYDKDKNGVITLNPGQPDDDSYSYDLSPNFSGGLGTIFSYRGFEFNAFFNFEKSKGFNGVRATAATGAIIPFNMPRDILKRWQKPGDLTEIARLTTLSSESYYNYSLSDAGYSDASYVRLSNLAVSYAIPRTVVDKLGVEMLRVYFQGQNLLLITNYKGLDPEIQNFYALPPSKIFVAGIQITL